MGGMRCLLLHGQDSKYDTLLEQQGVQVTSARVLETCLLDPGDVDMAEYAGVVVTSKHAARYLPQLALGGVKVAVVGPATVRLVDAEDVISADCAAILCDVILACHPLPRSWLYLCGNKSLETVPRRLRAEGLRVDCLQVYRAEKDKLLEERLLHLLNSTTFDAVVFFSPSGVEYTAALLAGRLAPTTLLVALGKSTLAALYASFPGWELRVCNEPSPCGVLHALLPHLKLGQDS